MQHEVNTPMNCGVWRDERAERGHHSRFFKAHQPLLWSSATKCIMSHTAGVDASPEPEPVLNCPGLSAGVEMSTGISCPPTFLTGSEGTRGSEEAGGEA